MTRASRRRYSAIAAGALAAAALCPAVDALADASFAWHMVQHLVLLYVVPLLVLLAAPFETFVAIAGKATVAATVAATRFLHRLAHPAAAFAAVVGFLWLVHFSPLYELSLERGGVHVAEHAMFLTAGLLMWLPAMAPAPLRPLPFPARLLYLLLLLPQGALLALALDSSSQPLYGHYSALEGALALDDQRNAAAVMWIGGGLVIFSAFLTTLAAWAIRETRMEARS